MMKEVKPDIKYYCLYQGYVKR